MRRTVTAVVLTAALAAIGVGIADAQTAQHRAPAVTTVLTHHHHVGGVVGGMLHIMNLPNH